MEIKELYKLYKSTRPVKHFIILKQASYLLFFVYQLFVIRCSALNRFFATQSKLGLCFE